jgi:hypothetical protein
MKEMLQAFFSHLVCWSNNSDFSGHALWEVLVDLDAAATLHLQSTNCLAAFSNHAANDRRRAVHNLYFVVKNVFAWGGGCQETNDNKRS